ncbi:autotransporter outer membrane beta-barrel domain-containing protein [Bradyrhizobium liaoningense]|uniref:autotransporter outer membrane beta-barrel domain-containing protein n=1 Tax=Bradyrhizobium liaoningense TaxID=43992 RepID=UPI001FE89C16|nr:autotransporter domain-containing protein [Bradyrhizobium liaoningense]
MARVPVRMLYVHRLCSPIWRVTAAVAIAGCAVLAVTVSAHAACSPTADNSPNPPPGTTVTCSGATTDQNGTAGYGTGNQTGIVIAVGSGASVTGSATSGINVGSATVSNSGSITGATNGIFSQNDINVTNNAGASITGTASSGVGSNNGSVTLVNSGTITANGNIGVFAFVNATVTNNAGGTITGDLGINSGYSAAANVTNSGNILGASYGVIAYGTATVSNKASGLISGGISGVVANQVLNVTNAGTIAGTNYGLDATGNVDVTNSATGAITGALDGVHTNTGSIAITNFGTISSAAGSAAYANANLTIANGAGGSLSGGVVANAGFANVTNLGTIAGLNNVAIFAFTDVNVTNGVGGQISSLINNAIYSNHGVATIANSGTISAGGSAYAIRAETSAVVANYAGAQISGGDTGVRASAGSVSVINYGVISGLTGNGIYAGTGGSTVFNAGTISGGTDAIQFAGSGNVLTIAPGSVITGNVLGGGSDTFQLGGSGAATFDVSALGVAAQYRGFSTFSKVDDSIWTLTGAGSFAGDIHVNGGALIVNGNIASANNLVVNAGGTLGGSGTVGSTVVNGGILSPGNSIGTIAVQGSLVFTVASTYLVQVSSSASDLTNVTGAATLAGTVRVALADGTLRFNSPYTILNAATLNGSRFDSIATPTGISGSLTYSGSTVQLVLGSGLAQIAGLNKNQRAVATALDAAFNSFGSVPAAYGGIFGGNVPANLTQASGELATGSQQTTFDAMNLFVNLLTDPFAAGRDRIASTATPFQEEGAVDSYAGGGRRRSVSERDAYAMVTTAPSGAGFDQRWRVWGAGLGGSQTTDGNAVQGSNTATSRIAGTAVGVDYSISPFTQAGFVLSGGGTNFVVANGLGSGRSDLFQAGANVRHTAGSAYVSGALAYGWQDVTTNRTVTIAGADQLRAQFNANAWAGRLEGGYRFLGPWAGMGITPYAAVQFTTFELPNYAEQAVGGTNTFALAYAAKSVTSPRSELGFRTDRSFAWSNSILTLRSRFGWAHDYNTDRSIAATFQTLPGASFVVGGASPAQDAALTSATAEMRWLNGFSLAATFEGEFSNVTSSYAGKGLLRYNW